MTKKLYLIDGYGFLFRAYHVMPPLSNPEGLPVGAVYGFTNMLIKLTREHKPDYMALVLDSGKDTFRNEIYKEYKANRPPAPEDLIPQFPLIRDAATAMGLRTLEMQGYEADDIIATYAKRAREQGVEVTIVSTDKDLMQLVSDGYVQMYDPVKARYIQEAEVHEKFGVYPGKVLDVLSLMGDSSDNVPGVPGIGPKTAAELINQYDTLDELLLRAEEIKQNKRRETIIANKEQALLSRSLISLHYDVPVTDKIEEFEYNGHQVQNLADFCRRQGFKSLLNKLENGGLKTSVGAKPETPTAIAGEKISFTREEITSSAQLSEWLKKISEKFAVFFVEDAGIALAAKSGSAFIKFSGASVVAGFDFDGTGQGLIREEVLKQLSPVFLEPSILKISHDIKANFDVSVAPFDDVQVMEYVLATGLTSGNFPDIAPDLPKVGDLKGSGKSKRTLRDIPAAELLEYACSHAEFLFIRHAELRQKLFTDKLLTVYEKIDKPLINVLSKMEGRGTKVDRAYLASLTSMFSEKIAEIEQQIYKLAGREFNIGSPAQIGEILFGEMSLDHGKRNKKSGKYSTSASVLEELALQGHEIAEKILDWRQLAKLMSTYTESLPKQIDLKTGRVHTEFNMTVTATGRLSSTEPNLQNIPIRSEEGRKIRNAFIAEPGNKLISADYSQIELRLLADVANIEPLKEAFRNGQDIHTITAHQIFGIPLEQVDGNYRRMAKTINFGIIYGLSAHGLSTRMRIPRSDAARFIEAYFAQYPGIREYMDNTVETCRRQGYVETIFGRKLYIRGINDKNHAIRSFSERAAINAPLQGSAADIIKKAMIELDRINAPMTLQVHDELLFEVPEADAEKAAAKIKSVMERAAMISVPLLVEAKIGDNWGEIH